MGNILETLEQSVIATLLRDATWMMTTLGIIHLLGVIVLVGSSIVFDLRLLGYYRRISTYQAYCFILPIAKKGMWLLVPSGVLLFITQATELGTSSVFLIKLGLLVIASINLWVFHRLVVPSSFGRQGAEELPQGSEISALISLGCWLAIVVCGKLL